MSEMTHDELLAKINKERLEDYSDPTGWYALRAVVELPMETNPKGTIMTAPANATLPELASLFYKQGYATAMNLVIQAIEKELQ